VADQLHLVERLLQGDRARRMGLLAHDERTVAGHRDRTDLVVGDLDVVRLRDGAVGGPGHRPRDGLRGVLAAVDLAAVGGTEDDKRLSFGMADALITRLSRIKEIAVRPTTSITTRCETPCSVIRRAASSSVSCGTAVTAGFMAVPPARWSSSERTVAAATRSRSDTTPHSDLAASGFSVTTMQCTRSPAMRAATARSDVSGVQWISPRCIASATVRPVLAAFTVIGPVSDII